MSKKTAAIDTMILIWGISSNSNTEEEKHTKYLFQQFEDEDVTVIIPSIVLGEYLVPVKQCDRDSVVSSLSTRFRIVPFDVTCAPLSAKLFKESKPDRILNSAGSRDVLKADAMIVASAHIAGAHYFFTHDVECRKMASTVMVAKKLPTCPTTLFDY